MRVIWDNKAEQNRDQIGYYIFDRFGPDSLDQFVEEVEETVDMLMRLPNIGKIDPLFAGRPIAYRSVVISGLSKLVYYVEDDIIHVAAFWDTRREPKNQAAQTR